MSARTETKKLFSEADFPSWIVEPYGKPTATSEVSRIADFYVAASLAVFSGSFFETRERADALTEAEKLAA